MSKSQVDFLRHILDECRFITQASTDCSTKEEFLRNEVLKRAIVRSLEIIGEATKNITVDFKLKWNTIQWKEMAGMRDKLIHDYMGINYYIVWDVVKNKIPSLEKSIAEIINKEE